MTGIAALFGRSLSAVTFVLDYVQFDFDGMQLTAYTLPEVEASGRRWTSQDLGWRDAPCARIGVLARIASCPQLQLPLPHRPLPYTIPAAHRNDVNSKISPL
jgi:hypothetical protein